MIFYDKLGENVFSNKKFLELDDYLDAEKARETLAEFLSYNLGLTVEILFGVKLFPFQEILLRSWFDHSFIINVAARGGSKSWLIALFCALYPIFYPNTRIVIASNSFRATRRILAQIERFINAKNAKLLKQCYESEHGELKFRRGNDETIMEIHGGYITALPLNEKIRGTRGEILICDEFGQISKSLYENILTPFLTAKNNIQEQLEIQEFENKLVELGEITEEERTVLQSNKKIIALTSATYDFEFAYEIFSAWTDKVLKDNKISQNYFVSRFSYKSLPKELIDENIMEEARNGGENSAGFQREYMAIFANSSDGYFDIKKLRQNTVPDGDLPCIQIKGSKDSKYILTIDPSFSSSKASDWFGMGVYLLNDDARTITQVHSYGKAGEDLKNHINYLLYLLSSFNIVMIVADLGGANFNFIETCNESSAFIERGIKLNFFEGNFDADDYIQQVKIAKNSYRTLDRKICYRQIFSAEWLRKSNEYLQAQIDKGKIIFASRLAGNDTMFQKAIEEDIPFIFKDKMEKMKNIADFIAIQDDFIEQVKCQIALIELKTSELGSYRYDLPVHLKKSKDPNRARKDLYTCILMACWGTKCYWDMMYTPVEKRVESYVPRIVR